MKWFSLIALFLMGCRIQHVPDYGSNAHLSGCESFLAGISFYDGSLFWAFAVCIAIGYFLARYFGRGKKS